LAKLVIKESIIKHNNINEPPADTNGVGKPFTGIKPIVIAEFIKICEKRIDVKPTTTSDEK
tara:strand:- start:56 stop:238 length:183 start_codon:yes stop_codon:yes gene_type:complete